MKDADDRLLNEARDFHARETGHREIHVGANFVECHECGCHAHLRGRHGNFIIHDSAWRVKRVGGASDFIWKGGEP